MTRVNELMTGHVVTVEADASCHDAVTLMVRNKIRHLPVVDGEGRPCGIVTDRDLRHHLFKPHVFGAVGRVPVEELLAGVHVREIMSAPLISIAGGAGLDEAAALMRDRRLGALPVVDHERIVGIVTETDLLARIVGANACCSDVEAIVVSYP